MNANVLFAGFCVYRAAHAIYSHYQMDAVHQKDQTRLNQRSDDCFGEARRVGRDGDAQVQDVSNAYRTATESAKTVTRYEGEKPTLDHLMKQLFVHAVFFVLNRVLITPWSEILYGASDLATSHSIYTKIKTIDSPLMVRIAIDGISIAYGVYEVCKNPH